MSTNPSDQNPRTRRDLNESRSSSRGPSDTTQPTQSKTSTKEKAKGQTFMDRWVEPVLASKPSYQGQSNTGPYGVLENMQPLGEAPSAKVKTRVKPDGMRKSTLGRSSAAAGMDTETPEGSPAPASAPPPSADTLPQEPIVIDDEKDADYAPNINGKKKERVSRSRAVKQKNESASSANPTAPAANPESTSASNDHSAEYAADKLRRVVEAAKARAVDLGNPGLASAVNEVYLWSLADIKLRSLLDAILNQEATPDQSVEFQGYVKLAKKKLKDAKNKARQQPTGKANGTQEIQKALSPTPKVPVQSAPPTGVFRTAIPSTEHPEGSKPRISLKIKSPSKLSNRRRSGNRNMTTSPRKRSGSAGSDSSLTSLTSNEDANTNDMDLDAPSMSDVNGVKTKDHAAERGSLAIPGGAVKRSSAEAELEEERDRTLAAKKQKLTEKINRDYDYEESHERPKIHPGSRVAKVKADARGVPSLRLDANGANARGSNALSMDVDSPLSDLSPPASRQNTPRPVKKPIGKRGAKTKQS